MQRATEALRIAGTTAANPCVNADAAESRAAALASQVASFEAVLEETKKSYALAVTRSSLLSSNPTLRAQHELLVKETTTLSEDDFWNTHAPTLADEYAKIYGKVRAGMSSGIKSNLELLGGSSQKPNAPSSSKNDKNKATTSSGQQHNRIKLGVEEMRQIFILYPAVHRVYETKVPQRIRRRR